MGFTYTPLNMLDSVLGCQHTKASFKVVEYKVHLACCYQGNIGAWLDS